MAYTISCQGKESLELDEYLELVRSKVDLGDEQSLADSAPWLHALANNRELIVQRLNDLVYDQFKTKGLPYSSSQTIFLGSGENFMLRANIWPSTADIVAGRVFQSQLIYDVAHDHNYHFLTVNFSGSGYETDIYEYDHDKVIGYVGEPVDMQLLQRAQFTKGSVMLYRASKDLHIQHPPKEMSVTINLIASLPEVRMREQYYFDVEQACISMYPDGGDSSVRSSFMQVVSMLGDENTVQLLSDLMKKHPSPRTRLAAAEALENMGQGAGVWDQALRDPHPLLVRAARLRLDSR